jgi:putative porin
LECTPGRPGPADAATTMLESAATMKRAAALACLVLAAPRAVAGADVYQPDKKYSLRLNVDALAREEWTWDVFVSPTETTSQDRWRLQLLPRLEIGVGKLVLGVGGEFNYSQDDNTAPLAGQTTQALIRDNYDSRDARVDLAYASVKPASWIRAEGGRFVMPIAFTEMIWDKDLRPQGGALTLGVRDRGAVKHMGLTSLWARGSHVFTDPDTTLFALAADTDLRLGEKTSLELVAAWMDWTEIKTLEPRLRRQNTRVAGQFVHDYEVLDFVGRLRFGGMLPVQLVGDYCVNTAVDQDNQGLWLAVVLGSVRTSLLRGEYTYAKVDKDATLAAYGTDDFFWVTGWRGHRVDLGGRIRDDVSLHVVGQVQQFKDSPRPEERDHWNRRVRAELRFSFGPR